MVTRRKRCTCALAAAVLLMVVLATPLAFAAEDAVEEHQAEPQAAGDMANAIRTVGLALAAAITMAGAALATAKVQAAIGAGGTGALVEKPDLFVTIVVLIAIPETILVLGFVVSLMLWTTIG
jgi:V/A-type H+/Na+-transporting ATPase subunit K